MEKTLPECCEAAKKGGGGPALRKAVDELLALEKHARNAEDVSATTKIALCIVSLCWELHDLKYHNACRLAH